MSRSREPRKDSPAEPGPRAPAARDQTLREALQRALREGPTSLSELSTAIRVAEKQLIDHLEHLARSLPHHGERLEVDGPRCLACGYDFPERTRLTRPSRCPICKSNRITRPRYSIAART